MIATGYSSSRLVLSVGQTDDDSRRTGERAFGLAFGEDEASLAGTDVVYEVWDDVLLRKETRKKGKGGGGRWQKKECNTINNSV